MLLSKPTRSLEWSEDDDDELACTPTILGGLQGPNASASAPVVSIQVAPRAPSLASFLSSSSSVFPPTVAEPRMSCRPTRRVPPRVDELVAARGSVRPTARPSQIPF
jgi:hypothetical protein